MQFLTLKIFSLLLFIGAAANLMQLQFCGIIRASGGGSNKWSRVPLRKYSARIARKQYDPSPISPIIELMHQILVFIKSRSRYKN